MEMIKMKKIIALLSFVLALNISSVQAQNASISTSVDKTQVPLGQSLTLEINYSNSQPPQADLSELRQDFDVVGVLESTNINIINGQHNMEYVRKFRIIPKREGDLTIPAFTDKQGNKSAPIVIKVLPAGSTVASPSGAPNTKVPALAQNESNFSMRGRINNNNPYVQQEIIYTLSLMDSGGLQGREPVFELNNKDWVIRAIGTPEINPLVVKGKKMREITFKYAMFPQRSGKLTIPAARFEGYTLSRPQKRIDPFADLFGDDLSATLGFTFAEQNPVILRSKPIEVEVKPIPSANNGNWWLPAQDVMLADKWEPDTTEFKVGEAIHRTVYLKADGVLDNQLPELQFAPVNGIKQYPEKPATEMSADKGRVVSIMKISNVYIPSTAGKMTLPEMKVNWFDVNSQKMKTATLPAKEISVVGGATAAINEPVATAEPENVSAEPQVQPQKEDAASQQAPAPTPTTPDYLPIVLIAVGAFALGILLAVWLMRSKAPAHEHGLKHWHKQVIALAKNRDLRGLRDALLNWGAEKFDCGKLNNFTELKDLVKDKAFAEELDKLNALLYTENDVEWDAKEFCRIFEGIAAKTRKKGKNDKLLPDLY